MKIYNIAIVSLSLMLSSVQTLASCDNSVDDTTGQTPSFQSPQVQSFLANENRYIVKYKPGSKDFQARMQHAIKKQSKGKLRMSASSVDGQLLTAGSFMPKENAEVVYLNSEEEIKQWSEKDDVEYVEHDVKVYLQSEETVPYGINTVHALDVPDTDVSNRKVCIIDSGYDIRHEDLPSDPNIVTGYMGDLSAGDTWQWDGSGHGTHVAGTIVATGGNNKGVTGVIRNGQVKLHIVRVFNNDGRWAWGSTLTSAVQELWMLDPMS